MAHLQLTSANCPIKLVRLRLIGCCSYVPRPVWL